MPETLDQAVDLLCSKALLTTKVVTSHKSSDVMS